VRAAEFPTLSTILPTNSTLATSPDGRTACAFGRSSAYSMQRAPREVRVKPDNAFICSVEPGDQKN